MGTLILTLYITIKPPQSPETYFLVMYLLRVCDCGAVLLIEFTFWTMMRSRLEQLEQHSSPDGKVLIANQTEEKEEPLETPLMGSIIDDSELSLEGLLQDDLEMN